MALDFHNGKKGLRPFAYDKPGVLNKLKKDRRFKVHCQPNLVAAVADADIVVLAATHKANAQMLARLSNLKNLNNALIIDTGAVKQPISTLAKRLRFSKGTEFLPTHPMAGREKAGFANSASGLFKNHSWYLDADTKLNKLNRMKLNWMLKKLGATPTYISNNFHDELMSEISHLPQLISTILGGQVNPDMIPLAGPGLRSMLRLAGSPYSVWSEIIDENRTEIIAALKTYSENLNQVTKMIKSKKSLAAIFRSASRSYRCL